MAELAHAVLALPEQREPHGIRLLLDDSVLLETAATPAAEQRQAIDRSGSAALGEDA
jgi:hypothetical protein